MVVGAPQITSQPVFSIFLCFPLLSGTWRTPGLSLMSSSRLFFYLPCVLPPLTVPCKIVLARPDERETCPYHCSLCLFTMVGFLCGPIACWILAWTSSLVTWSLYEMRSILRSTSFLWFAFFFGALLWGSVIYKHACRWMWQGSASVVSWNWEKYSCHSTLVSTLSMLLLSVLSLRVSQAWNPHQLYLSPGTWSLW